MKKFEAREFMRRAIEEMKKSVAEPRGDGKALPQVGAVLVRIEDNKVTDVVSAFRGELRDGDHAEFTLLERKSRDRALDQYVLFATLEPCAPGSRSHPKLGCAERIVLARIKKIWIGIEDPDPTVDRKGILYLQDSGIEVEMFDRDLQDEIRAENKAFLAQALDRSEEVRSRPVVLSSMEGSRPNVRWEDFSAEALRIYRDRAEISPGLQSDEFKVLLQRQGLLTASGEEIVPTGYGNILFGESPRESIPQAAVLATIHFSDGTEESRDFDGPQSMVPELAMSWLRDKLPNVMVRSDAVRESSSRNDAIFTLVREGLVNAIVHRDYDIELAKCQLVVYPSWIEILSPGELVKPITLEQMQDFSAPMLSRNPVLHFVFAKLRLAEERGLGLKSFRIRAEEEGLPRPKYSWNDPYLVLTIFLSDEGATDLLHKDVLDTLSQNEIEGWKWFSKMGTSGAADYADSLGIDIRTARRHFKRFVELGLVERVGAGPSTTYRIK